MRKFCVVIGSMLGFVMCGHSLRAQQVALDTDMGTPTSYVSAFASVGHFGTAGYTSAEVDNPVTPFPYVTPASATDVTATQGTATTSITPTITGNGFSFTGSGFLPAANSESNPAALIYFKALTNAPYSLSGTAILAGDYAPGIITAEFDDLTTSTVLYSAHPGIPGNGTITLDNTGGSLTGTLVAGHKYRYSTSVLGETTSTSFGVDVPTTLTTNFGISFVAPEPTSIAMMIPAGLMFLTRTKRRR